METFNTPKGEVTPPDYNLLVNKIPICNNFDSGDFQQKADRKLAAQLSVFSSTKED